VINCVIFDMDGTLVDSEILCNQAFKDLIPQIDVPVESLVELFSGRKLAWIFSEIESRFACKLSKDIEQRYRKRVEELFDSDLAAFDGVHEALDAIELPICIATSAPLQKVQHALLKTGLNKYFEGRLYSSYEIGSWKPEPDIFLHAAHQMNVSPSDCLVVEDSTAGITAAQKAGMKVVQFGNGKSPQSALCESSFSHYRELGQVILKS